MVDWTSGVINALAYPRATAAVDAPRCGRRAGKRSPRGGDLADMIAGTGTDCC